MIFDKLYVKCLRNKSSVAIRKYHKLNLTQGGLLYCYKQMEVCRYLPPVLYLAPLPVLDERKPWEVAHLRKAQRSFLRWVGFKSFIILRGYKTTECDKPPYNSTKVKLMNRIGVNR